MFAIILSVMVMLAQIEPLARTEIYYNANLIGLGLTE